MVNGCIVLSNKTLKVRLCIHPDWAPKPKAVVHFYYDLIVCEVISHTDFNLGEKGDVTEAALCRLN